MGIAATYFFSSNDTEKQTLLKRIMPSDEQFQEQQERWNALVDHLKEDLGERVGYPVLTWLQGSYKFGTQIRPPKMGGEFDIDLGIYFVWSGGPDDEDIAPKSLKHDVQQSLVRYQQSNSDDVIEVTEPKPRCCRIRYSGDFHIDVPTYHLGQVTDVKSLATEHNTWENSDPKAFYLWFKNSLDDFLRSKARRHIRYLKCWAGLKFDDEKGRPSSVLLTVLVTEAILALSSDQLASDDEGFKCIVDEIVARLNKNNKVLNPINKLECLSDRLSPSDLDTFLNRLEDLQDSSERAITATDVITACDVWSEAFQHFFPPPEEEKAASDVAGNSRGLPSVIRFEPMVQVTATQKNDNSRTWEGVNKIGPIPKHCSLQFSVLNYGQLPHGAEVYWIVRNNGGEAEYVNDLGHIAGQGPSRSENSAYNGNHCMDCIVKLGRTVIGFKRVPVEIKGNPIPRRNPSTRPSYTKLIGRR